MAETPDETAGNVSPVLDDANAAQTFSLKSKEGTDKQVTHEELLVLAQKGLGADEKFRTMAAEQKGWETQIAEAQDAVSFKEEFTKAVSGNDIEAFKNVARRLNIDEFGINAAVSTLEQLTNQGQETSPSANAPPQNVPVGVGNEAVQMADGAVIPFTRFSKPVQRVLRDAEEGRINRLRDTALDNHKELSYIIGKADDKQKSAILRMVDEKIDGRLTQTGGDFGDGSRILPGVCDEIAENLKTFGSLGDSVPPMGAGRSPGSGGLEVHPDKEPDHVSSTGSQAEFEQNILDELNHDQAKLESVGPVG